MADGLVLGRLESGSHDVRFLIASPVIIRIDQIAVTVVELKIGLARAPAKGRDGTHRHEQ